MENTDKGKTTATSENDTASTEMAALYKRIADFYIDKNCEAIGVRPTIYQLLDSGVSKEELLLLNFDANDVEMAYAEWKEE